MREIKFRAWDREKMLSWEQLVQQNYAIRYFFFVPDLLELMQYTGLKDKNGKEIYEGDIVRREQNKGKKTDHTIVFSDYRFAYTTEYHGSIALNKVVSQHQSLEVIGNIYENPELLGGKDENRKSIQNQK